MGRSRFALAGSKTRCLPASFKQTQTGISRGQTQQAWDLIALVLAGRLRPAGRGPFVIRCYVSIFKDW
jgi:hypothetical protein